MQAEKEAGTMSKSLSSDDKSLIVPLQPRAALRTASADEGHGDRHACQPHVEDVSRHGPCVLSAWPWLY